MYPIKMPEAKARVTWTECLLAGILVFGLAGTGSLLILLAGLVRLIRSDASFLDVLEGTVTTVAAFAATAAALVGVGAWRLIVATTDSPLRLGAYAGFVVGLIAHPLCWFLYLAVHVAREQIPLGQSVYSMAFGVVFMTAVHTLSSLVIVGWMSVPLCAALGYMAKWIKASASRRVGSSGLLGGNE